MLTKKQNLWETIRGGKPDRFVNQYEYIAQVFDPVILNALGNCPKGGSCINGWGVTIQYPNYVPGPFPDTSPEKVVVKDVASWRDYVKAPPTKLPEEAWAPFIAQAEAVDRNEVFLAPFVAPGIFEKLHYLIGMEEAMMAFYEEPEAMAELIDFLADWEIEHAKEYIRHIHPDALFHHDDWGSQKSTFLSPSMFEEFIVPAYKKIYGFWKDNGIELIVHHSDSYAATLVPYMIDMGIDIWQGVMTSNNIPALIKEYGPQISFMGGIDSAAIDFPGWTREKVRAEVRRCCDECGKLYFIPGASQGLAMSTFPGVYDATTEEIDAYSREVFR